MSLWHIIINCTNCKAALMPTRLMLDTNRKKREALDPERFPLLVCSRDYS